MRYRPVVLRVSLVRALGLVLVAAMITTTWIAPAASASVYPYVTVSGLIYTPYLFVDNPRSPEMLLTNDEGEVIDRTYVTPGGGFHFIYVPVEAKGTHYIQFVANGSGPRSATNSGLPLDIPALEIELRGGLDQHGYVLNLPRARGVTAFTSGYGSPSVIELVSVDTGVAVASESISSDGVGATISTSGIEPGDYTVRWRPATTYMRLERYGTALYAGNVTSLGDATVFRLEPGSDLVVPGYFDLSDWFARSIDAYARVNGVYPDGQGLNFFGSTGDFVSGYGGGAPRGNYKVQVFAPGYAAAFFPGVPTLDEATVYELPRQDPGTITLSEGYSISGTLEWGLSNYEGAYVQLLSADGEYIYGHEFGFTPLTTDPFVEAGQTYSAWNDPVSAWVDPDGGFSIDHVPDGDFLVYVDATAIGGPAYYLGDTYWSQDAAVVTVHAANVTLPTIDLPEVGGVEGHVSFDGINQLGDLTAVVLLAQREGTGPWIAVQRTMVDMQGSRQFDYSISALAGDYKIAFSNVSDPWVLASRYPIHHNGGFAEASSAPLLTVNPGTSVVVPQVHVSWLSDLTTSRISGSDRFATAAAVASQYPAGVDVVYVASGENFPDALSAVPAAAAQDAPLLTVRRDSLPSSVAAQLARLNPTTIIVVGGEAAISADVFEQIATYAGSGGIKRISGPDRYATARAVIEDYWGPLGTETVFFASGRNFPDALAAAAAAGAQGVPVMIVDGQSPRSVLDSSTLLGELGVQDAIVAGGFAAVSEETEVAIAGSIAESGRVIRYSGNNRYATAANLSLSEFPGADSVFIASGANFPDALAGAALAGSLGQPLYLSLPACLPADTVTALRASDTNHITVLGGTGAISYDPRAAQACQ